MKRFEVVSALAAVITEELNHHEEGLTTDLETVRKIIDAAVSAHNHLNRCDKCSTPNTGRHMEYYEGMLCPDCNPDKRIFVVIKEHDTCVAHSWELRLEVGFNQDEQALADRMKVDDVISLHDCDIQKLIRIK